MQTSSRIQLARVMCQRRQNMRTETEK